jgi:hypothetical protein
LFAFLFFVCVAVCLFVCLIVCLFDSLLDCLFDCLMDGLLDCLFACVIVYCRFGCLLFALLCWPQLPCCLLVASWPFSIKLSCPPFWPVPGT